MKELKRVENTDKQANILDGKFLVPSVKNSPGISLRRFVVLIKSLKDPAAAAIARLVVLKAREVDRFSSINYNQALEQSWLMLSELHTLAPSQMYAQVSNMFKVFILDKFPNEYEFAEEVAQKFIATGWEKYLKEMGLKNYTPKTKLEHAHFYMYVRLLSLRRSGKFSTRLIRFANDKWKSKVKQENKFDSFDKPVTEGADLTLGDTLADSKHSNSEREIHPRVAHFVEYMESRIKDEETREFILWFFELRFIEQLKKDDVIKIMEIDEKIYKSVYDKIIYHLEQYKKRFLSSTK